MRMRAIGVMAGLLAVIHLVPAQAQDEPKQQRSEKRYEQIDEARARVEVIEMELAAENHQLTQALKFLKSAELPVRGSTEPEPSDEQKKRYEEFVDRTQVGVKEHQARYVEMSKELGRAKRHLAALEGKRPETAKAPTAERRIRAIERIINEILREVED
jgi:ATP phosphoribosyltransferase